MNSARSPAASPGVRAPPRRPFKPCAAAGSRARGRPAPQAAAAAGGGGGGAGGGVLVLPGFLFSSRQYAGLVQELRSRGFDAEVVPMGVTDWLPVLSGGSFDWYLRRMDALAGELHARHGRIALVGHSAGGWIARILLGGELYRGVRYGRSGWVHTLLTLGTPHQSVEAYPLGKPTEKLWGPAVDRAEAAGQPGVRGSSLQFANFCYPDAASLGGVRVVTACGDAIRGRPLWGAGSGSGSDGSSSSSSSDGWSTGGSWLGSSSYASLGSQDGASTGRQGSRWDAFVAYEGYKSGCGRGDVDGDYVTPLCISTLPGAEQLVLPGVWHIPRRGQLWYGDGPVVDHWQRYLPQPQAQPQAAESV